MSPAPKVLPKKIGVQGTSMKVKRVSSSSSASTSSSSSSSSSSPNTFNAEERAQLRILSSMLPPAPKSNDPTQVVNQASHYIQQLIATVQARVNNGTLPKEALNALPPAFASASSSARSNVNQNKKKRRSVEKKR